MLTVDALGEQRFAAVTELDVGDWVAVQGPVVRTRKGELSVKATGVTLLGKGLRPLPDKWKGLHDVEVRSRQRELDLVVNPDARAAARLRIEVVQSLRQSMLARGFLEVETPILNPVPGGALARPFVTHHNALDTDLYLRVACELYLKRLLVGGMDRVFELGRVFRNEGIDSTHNTEFTMLESNAAFEDYRDMMVLARGVILEAADNAVGARRVTYRGAEIDLDAPWTEVTLLDAARGERGGRAAQGGRHEEAVADRLHRLRRADRDELDAAELAAVRGDRAVRADLDVGLVRAGRRGDRGLDEVAALGGEAAARVEPERAVAGQRLRAVGAADAEEAAVLDREVERAAGLADRALGEAAPDRGRGRAGAALDAPGGVADVQQVAEGDAHALVAVRVDVRQVVGDCVHSLLLRRHACGGAVQTFQHGSPEVGARLPRGGPAGAKRFSAR
jgi:hypothetical protein